MGGLKDRLSAERYCGEGIRKEHFKSTGHPLTILDSGDERMLRLTEDGNPGVKQYTGILAPNWALIEKTCSEYDGNEPDFD